MTWLKNLRNQVFTLLYPDNIGRWAISWEFWLALAPFRIPILDQRFFSNHENYWSQLFPILILGYLASGVPLLVASKTFLRKRLVIKPKLAPIIFTWLASDIFMTTAMNLLTNSDDLRHPRVLLPSSVLIHALGSIPIGAPLVIAVCTLFLARDRSKLLRQSLRHQRGLIDNLGDYYETVSDRLGKQVTESLLPGFARIAQDVRSLSESKIFKGKYADFAERVKMFSTQEVRELSHRLSRPAAYELERKDIDANLITDNTRIAVSVLAPANPSLAAFFFLGLQLVIAPEKPLWLSVTEAIVLWCATDICFKLHRILAHINPLLRVALLLLSIAAPTASVFATEAALTRNNQVVSILVFTFCLVVCSATVVYPYRYYFELERRLNRAEQKTNEYIESLRSASEEIHERFSRIIHGKVQGRLALVSFLLGQIAAGEIKPKERAGHFEKMRVLLNMINKEIRNLSKKQPKPALAIALKDLERDWVGLLTVEKNIEFQAAEVLRSDQHLDASIASIVEESVLNARLHGGASLVVVWLRHVGDSRIHLIVADNGVGPSKDSGPGLGHSMFSASCESWILTRDDSNNTVFSAVVVGKK